MSPCIDTVTANRLRKCRRLWSVMRLTCEKGNLMARGNLMKEAT